MQGIIIRFKYIKSAKSIIFKTKNIFDEIFYKHSELRKKIFLIKYSQTIFVCKYFILLANYIILLIL